MISKGHDGASERFVGIDLGAETLKAVEVLRDGAGLRLGRRRVIEHGKKPDHVLREVLGEWDWDGVTRAAVTGRLSRQVRLPRVPVKQAQARAYRFFFGQQPATVVSIGSHGFSVLELRKNGIEVFRENNRCSQGTGNFLRQLIERFSLGIEEASELCADVAQSAPLSGRCPVILKTDMTHLANKGDDRARILAGLFDAVCENVMVLIKPGISPSPVALIGGVARSRRIRHSFQRFLERMGMTMLPLAGDDFLYLEALGSALVAAEGTGTKPPFDRLLGKPAAIKLERLAPLRDALHRVRRMPRRSMAPVTDEHQDIILGFDIGSTGSKAVAIDARSRAMVWEGYRQTSGNPVGAAQALLRQFIEGPAGACGVLACGVTGSGREIVGSLLNTCYRKEAVFVLNEIAAHAEGACHYDPRVDTIFEIGGQDAKYIRLAEGRVIDCAMNEACSAGTGSFIEEQGSKFAGIQNVVQLGEAALASAEGVSLGQHCSVFMAEVIDEAVAAGVEQGAIIAGLYDSIIQNYLHRVKGSRSVGQVIFCQGMPFSADALAAAVARQTGSEVIIPPNPGTVGALGIALLAHKEIDLTGRAALDPTLFLRATIEQKDTFVCKATVGCGGAGNRCRIDSLKTVVNDQRQNFTWGGGCALYDKGTRKRKLPDRAPDPFREREELAQELIAARPKGRGFPRVALSDEFTLKGLFPFFATFIHELGLDLEILRAADHNDLKRGIQESNVPFCAPMQLFHGLASRLAEAGAEFLFLPMVRSLPRVAGESHAVTCPIVQASPDLLRWDLHPKGSTRILSPVFDLGTGNWDSEVFRQGCQRLAADLGKAGTRWEPAWQKAKEVQEQFDAQCLEIGRRALAFCAARDVMPVVVLGRAYTIYNTVLNSNVPAILREQGTLGIPVDCYPVDDSHPVFSSMYWGYGQRILRAAHQIRRTDGIYSLYCSNYSCGPDSFNLHFYSYIMEGKPFAILETDGHSGDAGTKTRVEAFLHCVAQDRVGAGSKPAPQDFRRVELNGVGLADIRRRAERILIPWLGPGSETLAVCMRAMGVMAEGLPMPDRETLRMGRRHTSGKECLPMCVTLGALLQRIQSEPDARARFAFLMPHTCGPCRFGIYNSLNHITLERLGWQDRVRIWSPVDTGYFKDFPPGFALLLFSGFMASDLLLNALMDARPGESRPGAAQEIYDRYQAELYALLTRRAQGDLSLSGALWQVASGRLFGVRRLLARAGTEFGAGREQMNRPTVLLVGEIYVRCDPFSNGFVVEKLESLGLRVRLAPVNEWIEYADQFWDRRNLRPPFPVRFRSAILARIQHLAHGAIAAKLDWPPHTPVRDVLAAAKPYMRQDLEGEAVLTIGSPVHEWQSGHIDAVLSVGPLECMPNKIAEAQFFHVAEQEGLLTLTLALNGEPVDPEVLDNFAFEVRARHGQMHRHHPGRGPARPPAGWTTTRRKST